MKAGVAAAVEAAEADAAPDAPAAAPPAAAPPAAATPAAARSPAAAAISTMLDPDPPEELKVDDILETRWKDGRRQFLVVWEGYDGLKLVGR